MFWLIIFAIGSLAILAYGMYKTCTSFTTAKQYSRERLEKTCDAVISLLSILISGSLLVISWVFDKFRAPGYGPWLFLGMAWLFTVLLFTLFMRFNFVWRISADTLEVGGGKNLVVLCWLPTIIAGLTFGLLCVGIPILRIAWTMPAPPAAPPQIIKVDCQPYVAQAAPTPAPAQTTHSDKSGKRGSRTKKKKKK